tara:strand:- start:32 stop:721 length:690 start_codon:yes stop_codon:yes gene_type:complete
METLSIIIPVYNEENTLKELLNRVNKIKLKGVTKEIIIVNDGSTDSTSKILDKQPHKIINHKRNIGKGAAVRSGIKNSTGSIIIIQDADLEYSPTEFQKIIDPILQNKTKVVYGSRIQAIKDNLNKMMKSHYLGNRFLATATNIIYGSTLTDMETCYKAFRKEVVENMKLRSKGFEIEPELTAKIIKKGYKIQEVPISFMGRKFSEGKKITWIDGVKALFYLLKYRIVN